MPYFALWQPDTEITGPPKKADLEGWKALPQSVLESRLLWVLGLLYTLYTSRLLIADGGVYGEYFELLFKSRAVHATTIDTILLYAFTPFWMSNDATVRGWKGSQGLLLFLSFVPLIGPLVYMILRPRDE
ncbi:unnamed protein product [Ostreobium quekettii]|uniref:DUF2834 domain-containing protein n=1 Tax=Ostreobium quekettii TaxID=121088 RepID=A0A8S1JF68_9CHLO|nr:unnamed protein product [Ostreobium quekettii]